MFRNVTTSCIFFLCFLGDCMTLAVVVNTTISGLLYVFIDLLYLVLALLHNARVR